MAATTPDEAPAAKNALVAKALDAAPVNCARTSKTDRTLRKEDN